MPKSEKQLPPKTSPNGASNRLEKSQTSATQRAGSDRNLSPLARITSVSQQTLDGIKFVVYGRAKTGKTRFASTFPKPMLLIGTEDGTKSVKSVKGLDFVRIYDPFELDALTEDLDQNPGKYKSVWLDQGGGLQDLILKSILGLDDIPLQKNWGMTDRQTWSLTGQQCKERFKNLLELADDHGTNVGIIAHERSFGDDENRQTDGIVPSIGAALTPSVCNWLNGAVDYIGQCYIRDETKTVKERVGDDEVIEEVKTGRKEYAMRVGPHSIYITGFRQDIGAPPLPEAITNPTYEKVTKFIGG